MKAFITGATGYIGFNVALAFRRAGYEVFGLTRSDAKAEMLARHEITAVIGDMQEPASYADVAAESDVLAHAAVDYERDTAALDTQTVETLIEAGAARGATVIYTSGVWVLGNTEGVVDENAPLAPAEAVAWRPDVEQMVLKSEDVTGIVIRPGVVYGKQGGLTGMWFDGASNGNFEVVGSGENAWAMVHVDDLADAYVRAGNYNKSGLFHVVDGTQSIVMEMAAAAATVAGYAGNIIFTPQEEATASMGAMAEALALDQRVDGSKAKRELEWQPRHAGFTDDVDTYFSAWQAYQ